MLRSMIAFAFTALASSAIAADMPIKAPPPPPAPVYLWTGCYLGGNFGWVQSSIHFEDSLFGDDGHLSTSRIAGGGQIGCDYQFYSNFVIGVRGMFDGVDINNSRLGVFNRDLIFHSDLHSFATVTGRLGYVATPQLLIYVTGGWGEVQQRFSVTRGLAGPQLISVDRNGSGGDVGVGFEWMWFPNVSFWIEWDHIFIDRKSIDFLRLPTDIIRSTENIQRDFDKVLFGFNWRFGGPPVSAPVAARY
jgi:outer membrane immunogenic protein